jgi:hypothetical protein
LKFNKGKIKDPDCTIASGSHLLLQDHQVDISWLAAFGLITMILPDWSWASLTSISPQELQLFKVF